MKIFFITSKLNFKTSGGSIKEFDLMMRTLQKLGNDVTAVTVFSRANNISNPLPYPVIEKNLMARDLIGIQRGLYKILKEFAPQADFIHVDGHSSLYAAGLYRRFGGKTPISAYFNRELTCWPDGESNQTNKNLLIIIKKKIRWYIEKYIGMPMANGLDLRLFTNPHLKKSYESFGLKPKPDASIIFGDPVDYKKLMSDNGLEKNSYLKRNKTDGRLNIFYSGRMVAGKGFKLLIEAFSKVKNKERFNLILGGVGPLEPQLRQMVKDLKIEPYVKMPGWVPKEQLLAVFKTADIFIQPRWRNDLTSVSLVEAMAFGLPGILPESGGLAWAAKNSALYFKDGSSDDLAEKIEKLGADPELRVNLSKACYKRLEEDEMNYEKQIYNWYALMKKIKAN